MQRKLLSQSAIDQLNVAMAAYQRGDLQLARRTLRDFEADNSLPVDGLRLRALVEGRLGHLEAAGSYARRALKLRPDEPGLLILMANVLLRKKQSGDAVKYLKKAIRHSNNDISVILDCSQLLFERQEFSVASKLLSEFEGLDESKAACVRLERARVEMLAGRPDKARRDFDDVITLGGLSRRALQNVGNTFLQIRDSERAVRAFTTILKAAPDEANAMSGLAFALQAQRRFTEALELFKKVAKCRPSSALAQANLGVILQTTGAIDDAYAQFEKAIALDRNCGPAIAGYAELLSWDGRYEEALALLEPAMRASKASPEVLASCARVLRYLKRPAEALKILEPAVSTGIFSGANARQARFTLGQILEDLGRFNEAFDSYEIANEMLPREFNRAAHARWLWEIRNAFSGQEIVSACKASSESSVCPVFIIGMPRSGTSLVEQILASHPEVTPGGERRDIGALAAEIGIDSSPVPPISDILRDTNSMRSAERYMSAVALDAGKARVVTDKMPFNYLFLGLINILFPQAKVIHCRRNALDTCISCYSTDFLDPGIRFASSLRDLGFYYREYADLMAYWREALSIRMYEIQYEALVRAPAEEVSGILKFLALPWNERCLRHNEHDRAVRTSSHAQVREPIYRRSVGRHRNFLARLGPLTEELSEISDD